MYLPENTLLHGGIYRIIRFISSGGFGCTYEAEHIMLGKRVAVKEFFVKDFCNRDENTAHVTLGTLSKKALVDKLRKKFLDEAKGLSKLRHPGIVSVSDVFEENGTAYFVMDYIDGKSLGDMVREDGFLPEKRAVDYIKKVSEALRYVHENNRLHLDLKPGNIMVDSNDNPILIDFGASKQYDEESGENTSTLMGKTPGYAPLEQMGNSVVQFTPCTDIYALGATLYKLLTGLTPLEANLLAIGEQLQPLPATISAPTRKAVMAAMQIGKAQRPQSIDEFLGYWDSASPAFQQATADERTEIAAKPTPESPKQPEPEKPSEPEPKPKKNSKLLPILLVAAVVVIGAVVGYFVAFSDSNDSISNNEIICNEIHYTSSDGNIVEMISIDEARKYPFGEGVSIVSNVYENGEGIITCDGNITTIDGAFYGCENLASITIPASVTSIGRATFYGCKSLTSITIPDNVTTIAGNDFINCVNLTAFYGRFASEDNRCLIVDGALYSFASAGLTSYTIPDSVTTIGSGAFTGCENLTSITIPNNITSIGLAAFNCCGSLTNITIPDSVTFIGEGAFLFCESLTSIYCKAVTPPGLADSVFEYTNDAPIYVPQESVEAYKTAGGWRRYSNRIKGYNF